MKIKKTYMLTLLLLFLSFIVFYTSYAFLTGVTEQHGKLNIVAGKLDYKLESSDLYDNKITVSANEIKVITVNLYSLNDIDSKYELFYLLDKANDNVKIGYSDDTKDSVLGTIGANGKKIIKVIIRNESSVSVKVTFGVVGGLINNELLLSKGNSLNRVLDKYAVYNVGEEITLIDGSKWHVLEDSSADQENIVLLSDYNLNSDGSYNVECGRDINSTYTCSTIAFDDDNTNDYDESDSNNVGYFIKNIYEPLVIESLPGTTYVSLPTAMQIVEADFQTFNQGSISLNNLWLLTTNYWTKTISTATSSTSFLWHVIGGDANINHHSANVSDFDGIRPVIITLKSNIFIE